MSASEFKNARSVSVSARAIEEIIRLVGNQTDPRFVGCLVHYHKMTLPMESGADEIRYNGYIVGSYSLDDVPNEALYNFHGRPFAFLLEDQDPDTPVSIDFVDGEFLVNRLKYL